MNGGVAAGGSVRGAAGPTHTHMCGSTSQHVGSPSTCQCCCMRSTYLEGLELIQAVHALIFMLRPDEAAKGVHKGGAARALLQVACTAGTGGSGSTGRASDRCSRTPKQCSRSRRRHANGCHSGQHALVWGGTGAHRGRGRPAPPQSSYPCPAPPLPAPAPRPLRRPWLHGSCCCC